MKIITLEEYHQQLLNADWFWSYSDCYETRASARNRIKQLERISQTHPVANKVWRDVKAWVDRAWKEPALKGPRCPQIHMQFTLLED